MKIEEIKKMGLGIFKFSWESGGSSVGCIWNDRYGNRNVAIANWLRPCFLDDINDWEIEKVEKVE